MLHYRTLPGKRRLGGSNYAWCTVTVCCRDVNVAASGVYDVREHLKSKLHERKLKCVQMTSYFKPKCQDSGDATTRAEVMFCYFVAEHNLHALMADHFSDLAREMFPVSRFECVSGLSVYWPIIALGTRECGVAKLCRDPTVQSEFFVRVSLLKTFN